MPSRIKPLARSTWPLAHEWATDTYLTSMVLFSHNSQKKCDVKFDPKYVMMMLGKLNEGYRSWSQLLYPRRSSHPIGLYSSILTKPPVDVVKGPIMSRLQHTNDQDGGIVMWLYAKTWTCLPKNWQLGHWRKSFFGVCQSRPVEIRSDCLPD